MKILIGFLTTATTATKYAFLANKKANDFLLFSTIISLIFYLKVHGGYTYNFRDDFIVLDAINLIEKGWLPSSNFSSPIGPFFYLLLWSPHEVSHLQIFVCILVNPQYYEPYYRTLLQVLCYVTLA